MLAVCAQVGALLAHGTNSQTQQTYSTLLFLWVSFKNAGLLLNTTTTRC